MSLDFLFSILIPIGASSLFLYLARKASEKEAMYLKGGARKMTIPRIYWIITVGMLALVVLLLMNDKVYENIESALLIFGFSAALIICGIYCYLFFQRNVVVYNESLIKWENWKGKRREMRWEDIVEIEYSGFKGIYRLKSENEHIDLHIHLIGIRQFLRYAQQRRGIQFQ